MTELRRRRGSCVTSPEMASGSITVTAVDANLQVLWDTPVHAAALRWGVPTRGDGAAPCAPTKAGPARENAVPVRVVRSGWSPRISVQSCNTQGYCGAS